MRKASVTVLFFGMALAGSFLYYASLASDYSVVSWYEWLISLFSRVGVKLKAQTNSGDYHSLALDMIAGFEGFRAKAYTDQAGYLTIGYGHKIVSGDGYDATSVITEAEGMVLLESDMATAEGCVTSNVRTSLSAEQVAALISLTFNIGCGAFSGSTLLRMLNNGDLAGAGGQFGLWNHANGVVLSALTNRRADEAAAFGVGLDASISNDDTGA